MWKSILKQPRLVNLKTFTKPRTKIKVDRNTTCNDKLRESDDKLNNTVVSLEPTLDSWEIASGAHDHYRMLEKKDKTKDEFIFEGIQPTYTPIPENVACKALEVLNKALGPDEMDEDEPIIIDDWKINRLHKNSQKVKRLGLRIAKNEIGEGIFPDIFLNHVLITHSNLDLMKYTNWHHIDVDWR